MCNKIPLFKVFISEEVVEEVKNILFSGYIGQGVKVDEFELYMKKLFNNPFIVSLNSCTAALYLALKLIADKPGDEILTTPLTCTATNWPILANGYRLRWVDVDQNTCNLDIEDLKVKLSPRTKGLMVLHWGGYPVDYEKLKEIKDIFRLNYDRELPIIEDCAHAFGSKYNNRSVGNFGNFSCFSFQAIKLITSIDGGILITPDELFYKRAKLQRWYGIDRESKSVDLRCDVDIPEWGLKFNMNDVCAAVGLANLKHHNVLINIHRKNAEYYDRTLRTIDGIKILERSNKSSPSFWLYTILVKRRDELMKKLKDYGIESSKVHGRNDNYSCARQFKELLPNLNIVYKELLCIPVGWWIKEEDLEYITNTIKSGW